MRDPVPCPDQPNSPFTPGYGRRPLVFGGHEDLLRDMGRVFQDHDFGENQSVLLSGLRGAGKTSMLQRIEDLARDAGWLVISEDASAGLQRRLVESTLPDVVNSLPRQTKRELKELGLWHFSAAWEVTERPSRPLMRNDLVTVAQHAGVRGILITIDEVSSGKTRLREVSAVAREISHAISRGAVIVVAFAGIKVDLDELVETALERVRRRRVDVEFEVHLEPWFVFGEQHGLSRAVVNVLDNAAKWSPRGRSVLVTLRQLDAGTAEFSVSDAGPGIPPEDRELVFERFYRSTQSRSMPGSGLGLAIVRQVVDRMGGTVSADQSSLGGAMITMTLPGRPTPVEPSPRVVRQ